MHLTDEQINDLACKANEIRQDLMTMLETAGSGHSAGPLGMADIFTAFYFHELKHNPHDPMWADRDRLILSNGHIVPIRYTAMHHAGYDISRDELMTLRQIDSKIEGHPSYAHFPALETSSGPLGEGLSQAAGMAQAAKMDGRSNDFHIWCIASDGEHEEGMTWEAAMFAAKYRLDNLTLIIDRNSIQIDGVTEDIMPLEPLKAKYESFNWTVLEMNGHDFQEIMTTLEESKAIQQSPVCIIANTVPGKGVDFMENDYQWHGDPPGGGPDDKVPEEKQAETALQQLRSLQGKIECSDDD